MRLSLLLDEGHDPFRDCIGRLRQVGEEIVRSQFGELKDIVPHLVVSVRGVGLRFSAQAVQTREVTRIFIPIHGEYIPL
jgi:hypothetical protein